MEISIDRTESEAVIPVDNRLEDDKIVEHWDVSQEVPEQAANENTMF